VTAAVEDAPKSTTPLTIHARPRWEFSAPHHAAEGAAAAVTATASRASRTSLAALITGHILRDGELVLLMLKPSLWYIVLSSLRFAAAAAIVAIAAELLDHRPASRFAYAEAAIFLTAGRVMWALLQWTGRVYILTDLRIIRLTGVFNVDIFDCPLRKVARTRLTYTVRERLARTGSIEITPQDESNPPGIWQTIPKPTEIHEQIVAAITKAKHNGWCDHD